MRFAFLLVLGSMLLVGCGSAPEKHTTVNGRVHKSGTALQVVNFDNGSGYVEVAFHPMDADGKPGERIESTNADVEGNFGTPPPGLKPGKYLVAVYQFDPYPDVDKLNGKFSPQNSPITIVIPEGQAEVQLDIDLDNPK